MDFKITKLSGNYVKSLCWRGDELIDLVRGGITYGLDGSLEQSKSTSRYLFDAATISPSGRYEAIYQRFGTKSIIIDNGRVLREINRSYYCADDYEYPIHLFALPDGREVIAHCPDKYNQIEIDDLLTGERLTPRKHTEPTDFFHSRLATNSTSTTLISAGWAWSPFDLIATFDIASVLKEPSLLDKSKMAPPDSPSIESSSVCFLGQDNIVVTCAKDAETFAENEDNPARYPGSIAVYNIKENRYISVAPLELEAGTLMPLGPEHVIGFHEYPKVIHIASGRVVHSWPDLITGTQMSSLKGCAKFTPLALDSNRRFAVADAESITVIELQ